MIVANPVGIIHHITQEIEVKGIVDECPRRDHDLIESKDVCNFQLGKLVLGLNFEFFPKSLVCLYEPVDHHWLQPLSIDLDCNLD